VHVCAAISEALRFEKVAMQLLDETGRHRMAASVGFQEDHVHGQALTADELERILRPEHEVAGCFLLTDDEAHELLPERALDYRSQRDGRGPHAWQNHWLLVPMHDRRDRRIGYIWVDDPIDRLRPEPERIQILRAFANQATTALEQAAQFEAVQTSDAYQRALIDASPIAIMEYDFDGRVRSWNAGATEMFGWTADEAIGRVSPIVPEDERDEFLRNMQRHRAGETLRDLDLRRRHKDGTLIDVSASGGPLRDAHGEVVGCIGLMIDVTARKRSERALATSEGRKDAILRASLDCIVIVDHEGLVVEINPAAEETLGWTRADAVGKPFLELAIAPDHRDELAEVLTSGTGPLLGTRLEISALRSDHRSFPAELAITRVDVAGPRLFAVSLHDVTKRREREERLGETEAKYRTLVEQIPLATYINDVGLPIRTTYMSPQIEAMLGYPVSAWLEPDFFPSVVHPDDRERVLAEGERTHTTGDDFRLEYRIVAADGRAVWVLDKTMAVRDATYRPIMLQGFIVDVTDGQTADESLREREELYRLVVESSPDLVCVIGADGTTRYVSPSVRAILGYEPEELVGGSWHADVHPDDAPEVAKRFAARAAGEAVSQTEARIRHKNGTWVLLEGDLSVLAGTNGAGTAFVSVSRPALRSALRAAG